MKPITEPDIPSHSFQLQRLGVVLEPEPGNPMEVEGVLNPASARGRNGQLYLFPRLVAPGNYSRIGIARVRFNEAGDPVGDSASRWSQRLITNFGPTAAVPRTRASLSSSRCSGM